MSDKRIIKKYPNRRLYDTAISSYVTLEDIKRLILDNFAILVVDAKTQQDITHNTLLQIILEQESQETPLFSNQILEQLIRLHGTPSHTGIQKVLDETLGLISDQSASTSQQPVTSVGTWLDGRVELHELHAEKAAG